MKKVYKIYCEVFNMWVFYSHLIELVKRNGDFILKTKTDADKHALTVYIYTDNILDYTIDFKSIHYYIREYKKVNILYSSYLRKIKGL